jgi:OOP family OmpA-OmpF porin
VAVSVRGEVPRPGKPDRDDADFEALRRLLVGPERRELDDLRARMEDPVRRAQDIGDALPAALARHSDDPRLATALTPPIERALTVSVRRNPGPLAEALFPVMGPAIRRAVSASLAAMMDSLNRTLEHSLSWRALQWRLEAARTGKPFAEIVLLHTLLYRVEQIFLIDRRTGLLLQHVRAGTMAVQDADMVSGMLTAIRDFVKDSFRVADAASLDTLEVGDLSVWIEQGPQAIIAAVIRGNAPKTFRRTLQHILETVHLQQADALAGFTGDAAAFDAVRPLLETTLHAEYRSPATRGVAAAGWFLAAAALVAAAAIGFLWFRQHTRQQHLLDALRAEPGIVVVSAEARGRRLIVSGLRDPLSRDPSTLVAPAELDAGDVEMRWDTFQTLDPRVAIERARALLHPPQSVRLSLADGILRAEGLAPIAWVAETSRLAPFVPGVARFDASPLVQDSLRALASRLEKTALLFLNGTTDLLPGEEARLEDVKSALQELNRVSEAIAERLHVDVVGHTDDVGSAQTNEALSRMRAEHVIGLLDASATPSLEFSAVGVGSHEPASDGAGDADQQRNRRVVLRVVAPGASRPARGAEGGTRR